MDRQEHARIDSEPAPDVAILKLRTRGVSRRHVIEPGELVTIGRSSSCQITVRDASVSREHCIAVYAAGRVCLNDLRSTHGITYRGHRVDRCELEPGDSCHLGSALLLFQSPGEPERLAKHHLARVVTDAQVDDETDGQAPEAPHEAGHALDLAPEGPDVEPDELGADATPPAAVAGTFEPPAEIAGYRLKERLGEGGFGVVYRAEHLHLGREVALKFLKPGLGDAKERVDAFLREARAAACLSDPHLVQVFDFGECDGTHFLSMELVEGESLARRLRRGGPMEWPQVMTLLRDLAQALHAAHTAGIVHRDVKPANILLSIDGSAKLTDLGLAGGSEHAGTVAYMAPEQLQRQPADARADIYALGCTAYAALTGSPPFLGSRQDIARAQLRDRPAAFEKRNATVPWHLQQLVLDSMLAKDPADRPQNAAALLERLERLLLPGEALPQAQQARPAPVSAQRIRRRASPSKTLLARLAAESITFSLIAVVVIIVLLLLKYRWPDFDIYRLIGR